MHIRFSAIDINGQYTGSHEKAVSEMRQLAQSLHQSHPGVFAEATVAADTTTFNVTAPPQLNPGVSEAALQRAFHINISTAYHETDTENRAAAFLRGQLTQKSNFSVLG